MTHVSACIFLSAAQPQPNDRREIKTFVASSALCNIALPVAFVAHAGNEIGISDRTI
jgi:hypothetical protein